MFTPQQRQFTQQMSQLLVQVSSDCSGESGVSSGFSSNEDAVNLGSRVFGSGNVIDRGLVNIFRVKHLRESQPHHKGLLTSSLAEIKIPTVAERREP